MKGATLLEIGLTRGMGSGKSTVSEMLTGRGVILVDADAIVRELQAPGTPVFEAMVARWGAGIVDKDGSLDRAEVAARVFVDAAELAALNSIVHPAVGKEIQRRRESLTGTDATVILDIPLLVESGYRDLDGVVVVDTELAVAVGRLVGLRGFTERDARKRIDAQSSREERLAIADLVLDNNGSIDDLAVEVERCWAWIETLDRPLLGRRVSRLRSRVEAE